MWNICRKIQNTESKFVDDSKITCNAVNDFQEWKIFCIYSTDLDFLCEYMSFYKPITWLSKWHYLHFFMFGRDFVDLFTATLFVTQSVRLFILSVSLLFSLLVTFFHLLHAWTNDLQDILCINIFVNFPIDVRSHSDQFIVIRSSLLSSVYVTYIVKSIHKFESVEFGAMAK